MTRSRLLGPGVVCALLVLGAASMAVGVIEVPLSRLGDPEVRHVIWVSRFPRTIALVLVGAAMAVTGMIMQMLARNRFVEPTTIGTAESAGLGLLVMAVLAPGAPVGVKMLVGALFALAGTALFMLILSRLRLHDVLIVPLVGIVLGGVIAAGTTFVAYRLDLIQSLGAWLGGDFSGVLAGRYELLWIVAVLVALAWVLADRFTVAGLGSGIATSLGLRHRQLVATGLVVVSVVTAAVVVTVGAIPFVGLVVPNLVSLIRGDNMRSTVGWVAAAGAALVLACDVLGRVVRAPYEIPVATIMGVVGGVVFVGLILARTRRVA